MESSILPIRQARRASSQSVIQIPATRDAVTEHAVSEHAVSENDDSKCATSENEAHESEAHENEGSEQEIPEHETSEIAASNDAAREAVSIAIMSKGERITTVSRDLLIHGSEYFKTILHEREMRGRKNVKLHFDRCQPSWVHGYLSICELAKGGPEGVYPLGPPVTVAGIRIPIHRGDWLSLRYFDELRGIFRMGTDFKNKGVCALIIAHVMDMMLLAIHTINEASLVGSDPEEISWLVHLTLEIYRFCDRIDAHVSDEISNLKCYLVLAFTHRLSQRHWEHHFTRMMSYSAFLDDFDVCEDIENTPCEVLELYEYWEYVIPTVREELIGWMYDEGV